MTSAESKRNEFDRHYDRAWSELQEYLSKGGKRGSSFCKNCIPATPAEWRQTRWFQAMLDRRIPEQVLAQLLWDNGHINDHDGSDWVK